MTYKRNSKPYDDLLTEKGISPEFIANMDSLRYSISKKIDSYANKYLRGSVLDLGAGKNHLRNIYSVNSSFWVSLDYDFRSSSIDVRGDGQKLPFKDRIFDTIICIDVLEHIPDTHNFLSEIFRVLKNNGIVILSTPFFFWLHEAPYDFYRFSKFGLEYIIKKNGLTVLEVSPIAGLISLFGFLISIFITRISYYYFPLLKILLKVNRIFQIGVLFKLDTILRTSNKFAQGHFIIAKKWEK